MLGVLGFGVWGCGAWAKMSARILHLELVYDVGFGVQ